MNVSEIKKILGEDFDVREKEGCPWLIEIGLRLTAVTQIHTMSIEESNLDVLVLERDKLLIMFKRKLTELLWKYLGEIPDA